MENSNNPYDPEIHVSDRDIFTRIWTVPRLVFKYINDNAYEKHWVLIMALAGIARSFDNASMRGTGGRYSLLTIIILCTLMGSLLGSLGVYIYAALVNLTGKWLKAAGDTRSLYRVYAYAAIPSAISLLFLIPQIAIFGNELFKADGDISGTGLLPGIIGYGAMAAEFILNIYAIGFCVIATSEVQKLSIGKSILNLVLSVLVIVVPILVLMMLLRA